jgi:hypothetical protein
LLYPDFATWAKSTGPERAISINQVHDFEIGKPERSNIASPMYVYPRHFTRRPWPPMKEFGYFLNNIFLPSNTS